MPSSYDSEADAAYIAIGRKVRNGEAVQQVPGISDPRGLGEITLDFDSAGHLIGVEVLGASRLLREEDLGLSSDAAPTESEPE
ncbi:MAG: DUF2283 domain-containing protein [Pseudoclavibacter sp.]